MDWLEQIQRKPTKITRTGASFIRAGAERAGTVQPGEEKAQGYIITVYKNLMGGNEDEEPVFSHSSAHIRRKGQNWG